MQYDSKNMSELKTLLSSRISGNDAKALAQADIKEELFQLLFDSDKRTSDNAAWVLTHLPKTADPWLAERQDLLIDEAMRTSSTTKRRLIMNLLERTSFDPDYGWGPNEYQPMGDLADFEYTDKYCKILEKWLEECD